jgi:hypothetical protein
MSQKFERLKTLLNELFQVERMIADLEARLRQHIISKQELFAGRRAVV